MKNMTLLLGVLFFVSCYNVEQNCNDFKTGTYKSEITIDDILYTSKFTRDSKLQIEEFKGSIDSASVRWINDCEMIFKTIKNHFCCLLVPEVDIRILLILLKLIQNLKK